VGPIVAVRLTLRLEDLRESLRRKYQTFHALIRTRRLALSSEHVTALNVIQTEFHDDEKIVAAHKKYIETLGVPVPTDPEGNKRVFNIRDDAFNDMMFEIGKHLGFTLDKRELAKYSYAPQGWVDVEAEQNALRRLALELLQGKRPLPVSPFQPNPAAGKFPRSERACIVSTFGGVTDRAALTTGAGGGAGG
jgi:hypothetical protein